MDSLLQDLRYAVRRLARSPAFTFVAVLTLALGIGANTAVFSVVNAVLLRPLPFAQADQLDLVQTTKEGLGTVPVAPPDFLQMQAETRAYEALAAYSLSFPSLTGEGDPVRLNGGAISASLFDLLGVGPVLGRTFAADENEPGRDRVALLGHSVWMERFGGDPGVIGRVIRLDGEPYEVVGVMPRGVDYPDGREIWTPLTYDGTFRSDSSRLGHYLSVVGRRKSGVEAAAGASDIAAIAGRIEQAFPGMKDGFGGTATPLRDEIVGPVRTPLLLLLGAVGMVLLIACVNIANLLLARAVAREGELAVRTALGAERRRLVRQLLTESVVMGVIGGMAGLLLGVWGTEWLLQIQPEGMPRLDEVRVDRSVVGFTGLLAVMTGLLFGLVPAYQVTRGEIARTLRESGRSGSAGPGAARVRRILVVLQTALAVLLLAGAGLLMRSFAALSSIDPGFRAEGTLALDLSLPVAAYPEPERVRTFYATLEERLRALPGVESVGSTSAPPMSAYSRRSPLLIAGLPEPPADEDRIVNIRTVSPELLVTLRVPLIRGRGFQPTDDARAPRVALLTESAAARFFPGLDPVGMRVANASRGETQWAEVVGIVGDVRGSDLTREGEPGMYFSALQETGRQMSLVLRTTADPAAIVPAVRREIATLDPNLPLFNVRSLEAALGAAVARPRFYMLMLSIFAAAALVLCAVGIFGVMSFTVVQRTREIGVRIALGAAPQSVVRMVVGGALGLALAGVAIGLLTAAAGARLLSSLLFGVGPADPVTLGGVALLLTMVAAAAGYLPARRATRVDPAVALRE